jgi:small subunit ribosomal protein S2
LDILTKKEKASKLLELEKLDKAFKWLKEMKKIPDVIFIIDWAFEAQALREANSLNLPSLAVLNTNGDPDKVEAFIPANTNSVKSINFIAAELKSCLSGIKAVSKAIPRKLTDKRPAIKAPAKKPDVKKEEK